MLLVDWLRLERCLEGALKAASLFDGSGQCVGTVARDLLYGGAGSLTAARDVSVTRDAVALLFVVCGALHRIAQAG